MKVKKAIKAFVVACCLSVAFSLTAFAATETEISTAIKEAQDGGATDAEIEQALKNSSNPAVVAGSNTLTVKIGNNTFYIAPGESDAVKNAIEGLKTNNTATNNATTVTTVQNQLKDQTNGLGSLFKEANLAGAAQSLEGFTPWIQLATGVLAALAILGTTLFTAVDVCYLAFPVMQGKMNDAANSGGAMSGRTKSGDAKFKLVTDDAVEAYQEAHGGGANGQGGGGNQWTLYLKKRAVAFIFTAVIIFVLLTGQVQIFIDLALKLVSGIIAQLQTLATP